MRLTIKDLATGKIHGVWVAKTKRGFNAKQRKEILEVRKRIDPSFSERFPLLSNPTPRWIDEESL